jgi:hypothetical protein
MKNKHKKTPTGIIQLNLFSEKNKLLVQMQNEMDKGNFNEAKNLLLLMKSHNLTLEDIKNKSAGIQFLQDIHLVDSERLEKYIEVLLNLDKIIELKALKDEYIHIHTGLIKIISRIIDVENYDFLNPKLHPSKIFLQVKEYEKTISNVNLYFEKKGENSLIRQYQAFAYFNLNEYSNASKSLAFAYFNDPSQCEENFIYEKEHKNLFENYKQKFADMNELWGQFVFRLWQTGNLKIILNAQSFEKYLINTLQKIEGQCSCYIVFLRSMYLAELYRMKNENFDSMLNFREQMKLANATLFAEYLTQIS